MSHKMQENLAELSVKIGVNIQKGQKLIINTPIDCADFARIVAEKAFAAGAGDVMMNYKDEKFSKIRYDHAALEALVDIPQWFVNKYDDLIDKGFAVISIYADDPELLKDTDPEKIKAATEATQKALQAYQTAMMANKCRWCVVSVPTVGWATKVFPQLSPEDAVHKLWQAIFKATRADIHDPVAAWRDHDRNFEEKANFLNEKQFDKFIYKNSIGTDFEIGMPKDHIWSGGSEAAADGVRFFPNIPTEEVFSAPDKSRANGRLVAAYPLVYNGQLIDDFAIDFKEGKAVNFKAKVGEDVLKTLIEAGEGSDYLGEIALVPYHSPISDMNLLFYNTLFDENASCHFALGAAYPMCLKGGVDMDLDALQKAGLNYSTTHEDFMVGTQDLSIVGVTVDGTEIQIFKDGDWAI